VEKLHTYSIKFSYENRNSGATHLEVKQEGSSIPVSVSKALRVFFKGLDRKQKFDAAQGITISCKREAATGEGTPEA
jgi:hypothetical protein